MKNGTKKYLSVLLAALLAVPAITVPAAADAPKEKEKKELSHAVVHEKETREEKEAKKEKQEKEEKIPRFSSVSPMLAMEAAPMLMSSYAAPLSEEDAADTVYVGETELQDGEWTADGLTESTGSLPASGYAYYKDGVLTLNNFKYEGAGYLWEDVKCSVPIYRDGSLEIKLEGSNALTTEATEYYPLAISAESLTISGTKDSTLDLEAYCGIYAYDGNVDISDSTITIDAYSDYYDTYGIYAHNGNVDISDSTITIDAYSYNYYYYTYGICAYGGNVDISDSTVNINSYYYGIYSGENVSISESTVNIVSDYYDGLYVSGNVSILNSTVNIDAYDEDGIYVYGDVSISESTVNIDAYYDGIDADGAVTISGASSEITITSDWRAISCFDVVLDDPLELLYPRTEGADYSAPVIYIAAAPEGFKDHDCTDETAWYSDISGHWQACADPSCPIPKRAEFAVDYAPHYTLPCTTCGETESNLIVGNHYLSEGEYLLNNGMSGTDALPVSSGYAFFKDGVLTLNNFECESEGCAVTCDGDLTIVLEGNSSLSSFGYYYDYYDYEKYYGAISIAGDLTIKGPGTLAIDSEGYGLWVDYNAFFAPSLEPAPCLLLMSESDDTTAPEEENTYNIVIDGAKITSSSENGICADGDFAIVNNSTANFYSRHADAICVYGTVSIIDSTLDLATDCDAHDYAGIYADAVEITDSTVTINSNCHGIYTYDSSLSYEELSDEVSDETAESAADITITRSNITIDAAYYTLRSETGITLIDCELPEGMEIAVVDDEYEDSPDYIPVMLSLTSEITDESNAGESTEEFENPVYTVVDADGQAVHHLVITYNKPADAPAEPAEDTDSPVPNLNLTGIRLTENGKTKTLPSAIGSRRTLTFTPAEGYCVADVLVNGKSVGAVETYTVVTVPGITVEVIYEELEG